MFARCSISRSKPTCRNYSTSRKYVLKSYDEVKLGDVISCTRSFDLYKIYKKTVEDELYVTTNGIRGVIQKETLTGEKTDIEQYLKSKNEQQSKSFGGAIKYVPRTNTCEFQNGLTTLKRSYSRGR